MFVHPLLHVNWINRAAYAIEVLTACYGPDSPFLRAHLASQGRNPELAQLPQWDRIQRIVSDDIRSSNKNALFARWAWVYGIVCIGTLFLQQPSGLYHVLALQLALAALFFTWIFYVYEPFRAARERLQETVFQLFPTIRMVLIAIPTVLKPVVESAVHERLEHNRGPPLRPLETRPTVQPRAPTKA
jgi:hypothetical protein